MDWLFDGLNVVAQAAPSPPTADELELIKQQMAFLQDANAALNATFDRYVSMVQLTLATAGGIVGVVAVLGAAVSIKSLQDFYGTLRSIEGKVREAVDRQIAVALRSDRSRLKRLEAILAREDIPERMRVDYVVPIATPQQRPQSLSFLLEVLQRRGFQPILKYEPAFQDPVAAQQRPSFKTDIVVLDLHHAGIDQDLDQANAVIQAIAAKVPSQRAALVVYGSARFYQAIADLTQRGDYCGASNNPLSLVARVLEAAYVVDAVKMT
ncbi:MAG: hypothetical protein F6K04_24635 [Leptolyngbya sp. SIO4C5]|nr:hypothetical protein [Leptolyngbya sp. SIO4C5]